MIAQKPSMYYYLHTYPSNSFGAKQQLEFKMAILELIGHSLSSVIFPVFKLNSSRARNTNHSSLLDDSRIKIPDDHLPDQQTNSKTTTAFVFVCVFGSNTTICLSSALIRADVVRENSQDNQCSRCTMQRIAFWN